MRPMSLMSSSIRGDVVGPVRRFPGVIFSCALLLSLLLAQRGADFLPVWALVFPGEWTIDFQGYVAKAMYWLVDDAAIGPLAFSDISRSLAWLIDAPMDVLRKLTVAGFHSGSGAAAVQVFPPLPWPLGFVGLVWIASRIGGFRLAVLFAATLTYILVFGYWQSAMFTMASIIIAVPLGIVGGIFWGIVGYRYAAAERALVPILDLMQTVPTFAYLVPVLFLFGFGPAAAIIATIIYAMPPMVRITLLSLKAVSSETIELGNMTGCTHWQLLWRILIPSATPGLLVGVNQVIMLSLNMVIVASMIGAGGLGYDVLISLRRLDVGKGLEAGIAIVLLAIALDQLGRAIANRPEPTHDETRSRAKRRRSVTGFLSCVVIGIAAYVFAHYVTALQAWPIAWTISTTDLSQTFVHWMTLTLFDTFETIKNALLLNVMIPLKRFLLQQPWPWALLLLSAAGWRLGGLRLAALIASLASFILLAGIWEKAMVTVYLCAIATLGSTLVGVPIGILATRNRFIWNAVHLLIDTLQTLPTFVYLIPVIMLLGVGDVSAIIAVIAYAVAPAIRYTAHGLTGVESYHIEAGLVSGCTPWQLLCKIRLPMAVPSILLGINQTIMMAFSMVVITALVGTRDLGQEVFMALSKAEPGKGLVAGLGIAVLAVTADRLVTASARKVQLRMGMASI